MPKDTNSYKVPAGMKAIYNSIIKMTDKYCQQSLNEEYRDLARQLTAAICRKRPSPITGRNLETWACGVIHALGTINYLFIKSSTPYVSTSNLSKAFKISPSTAGNKAKQIRDLLKISQFDHRWGLPSRIRANPLTWMTVIKDYIVDIRTLSKGQADNSSVRSFITIIEK